MVGLHIVDAAPDQTVDLAAGQCLFGEQGTCDAADQFPVPAINLNYYALRFIASIL
jgi:hypothetical protein